MTDFQATSSNTSIGREHKSDEKQPQYLSNREINIAILSRLDKLQSLTTVMSQAEFDGHGEATRCHLVLAANALVTEIQVLMDMFSEH
jgi:hypothetical protein